MSYSAARALTRIATPENEEELVQTARHTTAAQLELLVRAWRAADRAEGQERERARDGHPRPELWLLPEPDGSWTLRGRLDPETGALLRRALEAAAEQLYRKQAGEGEPKRPPAATRRADALSLLVQAALGGGLGGATRRADRFQVLLHVSAETLSGENENGARHEPPRLEPGGAAARQRGATGWWAARSPSRVRARTRDGTHETSPRKRPALAPLRSHRCFRELLKPKG